MATTTKDRLQEWTAPDAILSSTVVSTANWENDEWRVRYLFQRAREFQRSYLFDEKHDATRRKVWFVSI